MRTALTLFILLLALVALVAWMDVNLGRAIGHQLNTIPGY